MEMVRVEHHGNVGLLTLQRGVTNPFNLEMVRAVGEHLQELRDNPDVHGIVIKGSNQKFFSIGFDIPELFELDREGFREYYQAFNRMSLELYTLPKPTVAAITGHAIAGGTIFVLCCDYRIIASGRKLMGLNEIKLGVPVPYPGDCVLRQFVGDRAARNVMESGEFYEPEALYEMGMVDQMLGVDEVVPAALKFAGMMGAFSGDAYRVIKRNRIEMVEARIREHLAEKEDAFIDCWFSDRARVQLKEAMKTF
jgi:enoyl-CoA hydratase/carnithine racemase